MPVRNEAGYIQRSLEAVLAQDFSDGELEIIVADGQSTDGTREIIQQLAGMHPNLRLIDNPSRIVPTAMNAALRQARGGIIVRVDGHCEVAPDYVRRCVAHLTQGEADGVGGPVETVGETWLAQAIAAAMSSRFGVGDSAFRTSQGETRLADTVPFPAYTREIIQRAGPYDEELVRNQDDEYNYRIRALGGRILLAADVHSRYYSRGNLRSLWRQYYQYGFWKVRVLQKHPRQMRPRQFAPPAFVAGLIGSSLTGLVHPVGWLLLAGILGAYFLANGLASILTAARSGWQYLLVLPVTFGVLHVGYGLGFLLGLVKFARRWGERHGKSSLV